MRRFFILFFLFQLSPSGFSQAAINDTIFYPNKSWYNSNTLKKISLTDTELKFKEIKRLVDEIHQEDSLPYFEIKDKKLIRKVIPLRYDWGLFKERNFLNITEDSIIIGKNYSIAKLYDQLHEHYFNNGKIPNHSQSTRKATIKILIDSSRTASYLEKHIIRISREFDKLNHKHSDSLQLKLILDYPNRFPPPPPPPKEIQH